MRTLYQNGLFWTLDDRLPLTEALLVQDEWILAIGPAHELEGLLGPGDRRIDLRGQTVVPGLIDAHTHFAQFSFGLTDVNLEGVPSLAQALHLVRKRVEMAPPGRWIRGQGFNPNVWGRWPTCHDLDRVSRQHPIVLTSKDCHSIWVNSLAMQIAGVTEATPDPAGGRILRDRAGEPSGVLQDMATGLVLSVLPERTPEEYEEALALGMAAANRVGIASVHDMDDSTCFHALQALEARGKMTVRFYKQIPETALDGAVNAGLRTGFGTEWLRVGGVKLFADGSLGSQTAHLLKPYRGRPGYTGVPTHTSEELNHLVRRAVGHNLSVAIHAIGDAANRTVLDVLEAVAPEAARRGLRNRIEHVQMLTAEDLPRLAALGLIASVQPSHAPSDRHLANRYWGSRARLAYAYGSLLRSGARLAFGSDVPVEPLDPLAGIYAAVWRKRPDEPEALPWHPEEGLTLWEALTGFTQGAAYASGEEQIKGSLTAGKLADFVVLSHPIAEGDEEALRTVRPQAVVVGGRLVFGEL